MQLMRWVNSYAMNKNVFSLFLNVSRVMSGARSLVGRLFHTRGPSTAKGTVAAVSAFEPWSCRVADDYPAIWCLSCSRGRLRSGLSGTGGYRPAIHRVRHLSTGVLLTLARLRHMHEIQQYARCGHLEWWFAFTSSPSFTSVASPRRLCSKNVFYLSGL